MFGRRVAAVLAAMFAVVLLAAPLARAQVAGDDFDTDSFADASGGDGGSARGGDGGSGGDGVLSNCSSNSNDVDIDDVGDVECEAGGIGGAGGEGGESEGADGGIAFTIGRFFEPASGPSAPTNDDPNCVASTLFSDGFEADPAPALAATALVNWNVQAGGNVDVVNPFPGAIGHAIDLDGSTNVLPGDGTPVISLKVPIPVVAGRTYTVFYRIGTNPVVPADINRLNVTFGPAAASHSKDPLSFGTESVVALTFVAATTGTAQLTFNDPDPDDRGGVILDEVTVTEQCPA